MTIWLVITERRPFLLRMDPSNSAGPIDYSLSLRPASDWLSTPFRTSDARYSPWRAAQLLALYLDMGRVLGMSSREAADGQEEQQ